MGYYLYRYRYELAIWLMLMAFVGINLGVSFIPLGQINFAVNELISTIMMLIVAIFFMHLRSAANLLRLAAGTGLVWLTIFFVLTFADILTRSDIMLR
jgi:cytochrome c oxidase subunit 4